MDTARLFQSSRSQAVSLPKEYRFEGERASPLGLISIPPRQRLESPLKCSPGHRINPAGWFDRPDVILALALTR